MKLSLNGAFKKMPHIIVNHRTMTYKYVSTMCYLGYRNSIAWSYEKIKGYFEKNEKIFSTNQEKILDKTRKKRGKELASTGGIPSDRYGWYHGVRLTKTQISSRIKKLEKEAMVCRSG